MDKEFTGYLIKQSATAEMLGGLALLFTLFFFSGAVAVQEIFIGGIVLVLGIIIAARLSLREGIAINFETRQIFYFWGFYGFRFGERESLPSINHVLLFGYRERTNTHSSRYGWAAMGIDQPVYKLSIFNTETEFELLVMRTHDETLAFQLAEALAGHLHLPLEKDIRICR